MSQDKQQHGLILDRTLTYIFLMLGEREGVINAKARQFGKIKSSKLIEKAKNDLLSSILIYGGVRLLCSDQLGTVTDLTTLRNENIPVETHLPYDISQLERLNQIYQRALEHARFFDFDPRTASLISYDALLDGKLKYADDLEFETEVQEYNYYTGLLRQEVHWVTELAPELFSLFMRKQDAIGAAFNAFYREAYLGQSGVKKRFDIPSDLDVLHLMDLDTMSPDQIEGLVTGDLHFGLPGDYFDKFIEFDNESELGRVFQGQDQEIENSIKRHIFASIHDAHRFVQAHAFWKAVLEMNLLLSLSSKTSSQIKLLSDTLLQESYPISREEEKLQLYRLYVTEVNAVPRIETFHDLFRLHNHKYVKRFRRKLDEWSNAVQHGEVKALKRMRRDFELATRDLATAAKMQKVANVLTVVALPVAVGGMLTGLPIDFAFTAVGPALLAYSAMKERGASWIKFGSMS